MANKAQFGTYFVWLHAIKYDSYMYTHHVKPGDLPVADQTLLHLSIHMEKWTNLCYWLIAHQNKGNSLARHGYQSCSSDKTKNSENGNGNGNRSIGVCSINIYLKTSIVPLNNAVPNQWTTYSVYMCLGHQSPNLVPCHIMSHYKQLTFQ